MKIIFNNDIEETSLEVYQNDSESIIISAQLHEANDFIKIDYFMSPQELREFIGALLHIQQKLNKGGKHE
jgi:hypothetical protein